MAYISNGNNFLLVYIPAICIPELHYAEICHTRDHLLLDLLVTCAVSGRYTHMAGLGSWIPKQNHYTYGNWDHFTAHLCHCVSFDALKRCMWRSVSLWIPQWFSIMDCHALLLLITTGNWHGFMCTAKILHLLFTFIFHDFHFSERKNHALYRFAHQSTLSLIKDNSFNNEFKCITSTLNHEM